MPASLTAGDLVQVTLVANVLFPADSAYQGNLP